MTERGRNDVGLQSDRFDVGPSALAWRGDALEISIDEIAVPWPARVRGTVRVHPGVEPAQVFALDAGGLHVWQPVAPLARVEVVLDHPALSWSGHAYFDSNRGAEPLEDAFRGWHWSRAAARGGDAIVLYEVEPRTGERPPLGLRCRTDGGIDSFEPPPHAALGATGWRIRRMTRSARTTPATVVETLEDTPFYARSLVRAEMDGEVLTSVHESLSLDRFRSRWVQAMLPFRMPRRAR